MTTVHKNLTGADLHEPKGADTATSGKVYVSDGAGSGVWTDASTIITNTAFTTGDLKPTHKTAADTGWILWSDGTIGDGSSGASIRANADTAALFAVYWNGYSNAICPVSTGRGASAAADYAAHKTIALPVGAGRTLGLAGSGSGLTSRTLGGSLGVETFSLSHAQLPNVNFSINGITLSDPGHSHTNSLPVPGSGATWNSISGSSSNTLSGYPSTGFSTTGITISNQGTANSGGSGTAISLMQPSAFVNVMVKL